MNARLHPAVTALGTLLHAGYVYNDDLTFDLYGSVDDGAHSVETVTIAGTPHNVTTLLRGRQLINMGHWLDVKDSKVPSLREWAERYRHHAAAYTD